MRTISDAEMQCRPELAAPQIDAPPPVTASNTATALDGGPHAPITAPSVLSHR